jgi:hypothetical protein
MNNNNEITTILDRSVVLVRNDVPYSCYFKSYCHDERVILRLMSDAIKYHSPDLRSYNENDLFHAEVNNIIKQLLSFDSVPLNYLEKEEYILDGKQHSPLSFAIDYGFYDVTKALSRRKDLDPNFDYAENFGKKHVPASLIWNHYNNNMLVQGAYQAFLGIDGLKLNELQWHRLYHSIINNYTTDNLESVLAALELLKMLIEKYKLPSRLIRVAKDDIVKLRKDGISLIKDK